VRSSLGDGVTLDDFRPAQLLAAAATARRVRWYLASATLIFIGLALYSLYLASHSDGKQDLFYAAFWALALGGLGAVASVFLHVLKMVPQESLRTSDEFEVLSRILLGCLFSIILTMTLTITEVGDFMKVMHGALTEIKGGYKLLLPFLSGYSLPLVLKLLDKAITAVELTIGAQDRRTGTGRTASVSGRRARRGL